MWHTSLSTTIYNTHPPYQVVYLTRETFPIIPFARTAAAVWLPVQPLHHPQHPPLGSNQIFCLITQISGVKISATMQILLFENKEYEYWCLESPLYKIEVKDDWLFPSWELKLSNVFSLVTHTTVSRTVLLTVEDVLHFNSLENTVNIL